MTEQNENAPADIVSDEELDDVAGGGIMPAHEFGDKLHRFPPPRSAVQPPIIT